MASQSGTITFNPLFNVDAVLELLKRGCSSRSDDRENLGITAIVVAV